MKMRVWELLIAIAVLLLGAEMRGAKFTEIEEISPRPARSGETIAIIGSGFGEDADGSGLWMGRCPSQPGAPGGGTVHVSRGDLSAWSDTRIELKLPVWASGSVMVQPSRGPVSNTATFKIVDACRE